MEVDRSRAAVDRARVEPIPDIAFEGLVNWIDNGIGGKPDGSVRSSHAYAAFQPQPGRHRPGGARAGRRPPSISQTEFSLQARLALVFEQYANARDRWNATRRRSCPPPRNRFRSRGKPTPPAWRTTRHCSQRSVPTPKRSSTIWTPSERCGSPRSKSTACCFAAAWTPIPRHRHRPSRGVSWPVGADAIGRRATTPSSQIEVQLTAPAPPAPGPDV